MIGAGQQALCALSNQPFNLCVSLAHWGIDSVRFLRLSLCYHAHRLVWFALAGLFDVFIGLPLPPERLAD